MSHSKHNDSHHTKDGIIDFTAGFLGGVALVYVGQPLDTVKVKMQTFPSLYGNMIYCFKHTFLTDGIAKGLYAGTVPALVANVGENSVLFLGYGFCQKFIQKVTGTDNVNNLSTLSNATAGFLAAFFSSLVLCPTELIKCKLQAMYEIEKQEIALNRAFKRVGPFSLTARIFRSDGVTGLFRGLTPTLMREMPGYFFFFGGYEGARELLKKPGQSKEDIGVGKTMVAGASGGVIFWTTTYPFDVVKSRVQVDSKLSGGLIATLLHIAKNEGVTALYSGLTPTLVRTIPATAVLFLTYEYTKKFLHCV
ncbi:mitochondrial carrier protein, partial [Oryctes borbonicus]